MDDGPSRRPVALITGGTRRLGAGLADHLARAGWDLVLAYRSDREAAEATVAALARHGGDVRAVACDVAKEAQVARMMAELADLEGRLDLLIHNVGIYRPVPVMQMTPANWDATLQTNLSGGFYCYHHARDMLIAAHGLIVFLGFAGVEALRADIENTDYQISKTGLLVLTKSLGRALAGTGVRVNMISPGQMANSVDLPEDLADIPAGRAGEIADLVQALDYLLAARYVTGVNIDVAGGHRL